MKTHKYPKRGSIIGELLNRISSLEREQTKAKMLIAVKISEAMQKKGWKHNDLLAAMDKSNPSLVTKWLSGTHNFTLDTLIELELALGIRLLNVETNITEIHPEKKKLSKKKTVV